MKLIEQQILDKFKFRLKKAGFESDNLKSLADGVNLRDGIMPSPIIYGVERCEMDYLTQEQWDYLIENSDLSYSDPVGFTTLSVAILNCRSIKFNEEQYQKLIEGCPQNGLTTDHECDLLLAVSLQHILEFTEKNWVTLIKKTPEKYFNNISLALTARLGLNVKITEKIADEIIKKIDFDFKNIDGFRIADETLYVFVKGGQFGGAMKLVEKMGPDKTREFIERLEWDGMGGETISNLKQIIEIVETKNSINLGITANSTKKEIKAKI